MLKDEVASWRKSFTDTTDDELILTMHKRVPHAPDHIAAKQELAARRESREQTRHRELETRLEDLKVPHWSVPWTFWVASAAAIIALGAWIFPRAPASPRDDLPALSAPVPATSALLPAHTPAPAASAAPPLQPSPSSSTPAPLPKPAPTPAVQQSKSLPAPPKE